MPLMLSLKELTTVTAKWNALMLSMIEFGAGLAHGGTNMDAAYIYAKGNTYMLFSVAGAYGVA